MENNTLYLTDYQDLVIGLLDFTTKKLKEKILKFMEYEIIYIYDLFSWRM